MSNLVDHARRELEILGCTEEDITDIVKVVQSFAEINPSGSQAAWMIPLIYKLMQFQNLTPLTDDPKEWVCHTPPTVAEEVWQNTRCGEAFSTNGGRTYYLLSEGGNANNGGLIMHASVLTKKNID